MTSITGCSIAIRRYAFVIIVSAVLVAIAEAPRTNVRALIVEDDPSLALPVRAVLEQEGFEADVVPTAAWALTLAPRHEYDVIVLEIGRPHGAAIPLILELRRQGRSTPLLVITGTADKDSWLQAMDAGADDWLAKPIDLDAFRARIRSLVRRNRSRAAEELQMGNLVLNRFTRALNVGGAAVPLTPRELALLEYFLLHAGEVVPRAELLQHVLDTSFDPGTNVLEVNVARLRRKLTGSGATVSVRSRRGVGYVLEATG